MKKEKLPDFETDEEFAEFFETHSFADYWDEFEDVEDVSLKRPMRKRITIRIFPYVLNNIRAIAKKQGMPYQTLIQQWLAERLSEEQKRIALSRTES